MVAERLALLHGITFPTNSNLFQDICNLMALNPWGDIIGSLAIPFSDILRTSIRNEAMIFLTDVRFLRMKIEEPEVMKKI